MREAIFEAAVSVLAEHGVEGMTMERVAAAARLAKGSLYHYFSGKQAILELVHSRLIDPIIEQLQELAASTESAVTKLSNHLEWLFAHVAQHARVFKLLFQDYAALGLLQSSERRSHELASHFLSQIFRQGIAEDAFRPVEPQVLTMMFLGLCRGIFDAHPLLDTPQQQQQISNLILTTYLNGIATSDYRQGCQ